MTEWTQESLDALKALMVARPMNYVECVVEGDLIDRGEALRVLKAWETRILNTAHIARREDKKDLAGMAWSAGEALDIISNLPIIRFTFPEVKEGEK